jgi:hypothetical protein
MRTCIHVLDAYIVTALVFRLNGGVVQGSRLRFKTRINVSSVIPLDIDVSSDQASTSSRPGYELASSSTELQSNQGLSLLMTVLETGRELSGESLSRSIITWHCLQHRQQDSKEADVYISAVSPPKNIAPNVIPGVLKLLASEKSPSSSETLMPE